MEEKWEDYLKFKKEHPEIDVELMEDAYEKCQGEPATIKKLTNMFMKISVGGV